VSSKASFIGKKLFVSLLSNHIVKSQCRRGLATISLHCPLKQFIGTFHFLLYETPPHVSILVLILYWCFFMELWWHNRTVLSPLHYRFIGWRYWQRERKEKKRGPWCLKYTLPFFLTIVLPSRKKLIYTYFYQICTQIFNIYSTLSLLVVCRIYFHNTPSIETIIGNIFL
jgi:hypothetical protein